MNFDMSDKGIKDWNVLMLKLHKDIKRLFKDEKLNYEQDVIRKLARHSFDFIVRILNDADNLKNDDTIEKKNISLALALEAENRLAICQALPYKELIDISVVYNSKELPEIRKSYGLKIPIDNLTKINYKLKSKYKEAQSRKSLYHEISNHLKYMNPYMPNSTQISRPMYESPNPVMNRSPASLYATLYAQQQPSMQQSYMQQPTMSTYAPQQNKPSPKQQQPQYSYTQEMQMPPQRLVFRPRFNIVTRNENNVNSSNSNKRKNM